MEVRGSGAGHPQTAFARRAVTVPGVALPLRGQQVTMSISLRPTVTGCRYSQKAAKQLVGGWADILRERSLFFLTELSRASIHGGFPRHLPVPQLPEVLGY